MITTFIAERLFDGRQMHYDCPISIEDGYICALDTVNGATEHRLPGLLAPGFIDVQVNGGGGRLFNHDTNSQTLSAMVKAHAKYGTTGCLPTLITDDLSRIHTAAEVISQAVAAKQPGILGVHFEGPHISRAKKGIHRADKICPLGQEALDIYCRDDLGTKVVTLAPETVDVETIKTLVAHDVHVCLGHSNASFEQVNAALAAGATGFTHLFNAMSGLESRAPNMVGAALLDQHSWCGLILDGHHVHPATAQLALRAKTTGQMMLVSDAMSTIGSDQSLLSFDGHEIHLSGDKLTSHTGQLAGSALEMITAVNNARQMLDVSLEEALRMASMYPANFLTMSGLRGELTCGAKADLVQLAETPGAGLEVINSWSAGISLYQ